MSIFTRSVRSVVKYTVVEAVRDGALAASLILLLLSPLAGKFVSRLTLLDGDSGFRSVVLSAVSIGVFLLGTLYTHAALRREIESGALLSMLTRPAGAWGYLLGRQKGFTSIIGIFCLAGALLVLLSGIAPAGAALLYGITLFLKGAVVVSVTMLFTLLSRSPFIALVASVGSYILFHMQAGLTEIANRTKDPLITLIADAMGWVFPSYGFFDIKQHLLYGDAVSWGVLATMLPYAILWTGIVQCVAYFDLTGKKN